MSSSFLWVLLAGCHRVPADPPASAPETTMTPESTPARAPLLLRRGEELRLLDGTTVTLDGYEEHASGAAQVTLLVSGQSLVLLDGVSGHDATGWVGEHRIMLGAYHAYEVQLFIDQRSQTVMTDSAKSLRIQRGEAVPLDGRLHLSFRSHGHKHVMAGGPSSPLIVRVEYLQQAESDYSVFRSIEQASYNLFPPESATWRWRDHQIRLIDHHYGSWMDLEISRLELVPVQL